MKTTLDALKYGDLFHIYYWDGRMMEDVIYTRTKAISGVVGEPDNPNQDYFYVHPDVERDTVPVYLIENQINNG